MTEADIEQFVRAHYSQPKASVLLLSQLGAWLVERGAWPPEGDKRSLSEIIDAIPAISVVRESTESGFIAVTLKGEEGRALAEIAERKRRYFLRGLPRALLHAFTLDIIAGHVMGISLEPTVRFGTGETVPDGMVLVDGDLRLPGLDVRDLPNLDSQAIEQLEANIRAWFTRHGLDHSILARTRSRTKPKPEPKPSAQHAYSNALERLLAAQDPEVARRLIIPADLALTLSRIP